ncbi:MAG: SDR family oxidoreductase [Rhodospirillales bacterium]|nr:SDR family oxidoreductase [Rhodospirillales bacterium]
MNDEVNAKKITAKPDFSGMTALVTGAGRGLGRASALSLAEAGAHVIGVARTEADLESLKAQNPERIEYWVHDVLEDDLYPRIEKLGRLDIAVTSAGGNKPEPLMEVTVETLDWMMDLNLKSVFRTAQSAARVMLKGGSGSIINISSQMCHVGAPNRTVYCATKHGVEGMTKAMGVELAPQGVRVNSIAATFVDTPMTRPMFENLEFKETVLNNIALGHLASLDDIASAVLFLAGPGAAMLTGTSLRVDGGWTAW